jgi:glutamate-1-semialdehyde 2,1-aminomutase
VVGDVVGDLVTAVSPADDVVGQPLAAGGGLIRAYTERTPGSAASFEAARRVLPGGETRAVTSYPPYPVIITEGRGARLTDADGHVYLDLVNNYTAMVHGSAFGPAVEAVADLLPQGYAFASPHPYQVALAELISARVPSVQRIRFTNSGTEAALLAARIASRATGRRRLLMFDGAYHGSAALFLPGSPDVVRAPWNDLAAVEALLGSGHDVAAVFAEPFLGAGGVRPAEPGFLAAVAGLAASQGVLFVLDEVQGLRNGLGGEQGRLGLTPDLTLLGKIIGGGFPIGAVGGRADLLELTVASMTPGNVTHAGTFNGHLAAMAAGLMTLRYLDGAAITRLNEAAAALSAGIVAGATAAGVAAEVTRAGSIMNVHLREPAQLADLHIALLLNGVYTTPRGMINLSTALSPGDLDDIAAAYAAAFTQVRRA